MMNARPVDSDEEYSQDCGSSMGVERTVTWETEKRVASEGSRRADYRSERNQNISKSGDVYNTI